MFGLDDAIASFSDGASLALVAIVAVLLGLRHATDPDHLAAVTALIGSAGEPTARGAARLGFAWGLGHALTLLAFGLPVVLFNAYLPEWVQQLAEALVGIVIIVLALGLLLRWRRSRFHLHPHGHGGPEHVHLHSHSSDSGHRHPHAAHARSPLEAFGIGLLHGLAGSAGVGILLVATIDSRPYGIAALSVLALFTAVSMTVLTSGFGFGLALGAGRGTSQPVTLALGAASLTFGVWYLLGAVKLVPYIF